MEDSKYPTLYLYVCGLMANLWQVSITTMQVIIFVREAIYEAFLMFKELWILPG